MQIIVRWEDDGDIMKRPQRFGFTLTGSVNGETVYGSVNGTATMFTNWVTSVNGLPVTDAQGNLISYSVGEVNVAGYTVSYEVTGDRITVVLTYDPEAPAEERGSGGGYVTFHDPRVPLAGGIMLMQLGDCVN